MRKQFQEDDSRRAFSERSRGPLGWFPRLGMSLLAFAADAGGAPSADASCPTGYTGGGAVGDQFCCGLARPDNECCYPTGGGKQDFICPSGSNKTMWFCPQGGNIYGCGECSGGKNCFSYPWSCSIAFQVQTI
jgi:hypothetical protein